jgi:hypothetical protein
MAGYQGSPEKERHQSWQHLDATSVAPIGAVTRAESPAVSGIGRRKLTALVIAAVAATTWWVAAPSPTEVDGSVPLVGNLRLSSDGLIAPVVLVRGTERGWGIMRAPTRGHPRVIPISRADKELRVISLGMSSVAVRAEIAGRHGLQSFGADGRVVTVLQADHGTGIRTAF